MDFNECCRVLQIEQNLPWEEIKKNYYTLAMKYHPDKNRGNLEFEERFKEISLAFQTLERKFLRDKVDPYATEESPGSSNDSTGSNVVLNFIKNQACKNSKTRRIVEKLGRVMSQLDKTIFQLDVRQEVAISATVAERGGMVRIRKGKENFEVRIPPGAWDKMILKIPERGEPSLFGNGRGDLTISIKILHDSKSGNKDLQAYYNLFVSKKHIADGRACTLNTAEGPIKFFLPKTAREGQSFTLSGQKTSDNPQRKAHVVTLNFVDQDYVKVEEIQAE